jgi:hypothetical protein
MFADLYHHGLAAATYGTVTTGIAVLCAGLGASWTPVIAAGGVLLAATGVLAAANLSARPLHLLAAVRAGTDLAAATTQRPEPAERRT